MFIKQLHRLMIVNQDVLVSNSAWFCMRDTFQFVCGGLRTLYYILYFCVYGTGVVTVPIHYHVIVCIVVDINCFESVFLHQYMYVVNCFDIGIHEW